MPLAPSSRRLLLQPLLAIGFLVAACGLAWYEFLSMGSGHPALLLEARGQVWSHRDYLASAAMWSLMMAGMMLPATAPWIWNLSRTWLQRRSPQGWLIPLAFLAGYLAAWSLFSLSAAGLQGLLAGASVQLPDRFQAFQEGVILILAGLYQWSPVKDRCLTHCRSPLGFFLTSWRPGVRGGAVMGLRHGLFCVGCCWLLMLLALVVGVMNLLWMIVLTIYVFIDHSLLKTRRVGRLAGLLLIGWGISKWIPGIL